MKHLKIYFTSDTHGSVYPTDYTDNLIKNMGLLAIGSTIEKDGNTLVIDGGDTIQGSPFSTYILDKTYDVNPMAKVMNMVGFDYVTLGNHDFNYGYDYLMNYLGDLDARVLCGNVKDTSDGNPDLIQTSVIHTLDNGIKVGLVGITTEYINIWEKKEHLEHLQVTDPFPVAEKEIQRLKDQTDVLVGIYHGGFENDIHSHKQLSHTKENIAFKLSKELDFDVLLTGHQHIPMADETLFGTHIAQTPMNAVKFVELNLEFSDDHALLSIESELKSPVPDIHEDNYQVYGYLQNDIQVWLDKYVGQLDMALEPSSHLEMALSGCSIANFLNQIQLEASGADLSCTSLANKVIGLPKDVTLRDIVSTYIYPNTLQVLEITGDMLKMALERCAEYFDVTDGGVNVSDTFMKPKVAHYNYDYFSGVDYCFDLTRPVGERVTSMTVGGQVVQMDQTFTLTMNNYRSTGSGGYEFYTDCDIKQDIQVTTTDLVIDFIKKHPVVEVDKRVYLTVKQ